MNVKQNLLFLFIIYIVFASSFISDTTAKGINSLIIVLFFIAIAIKMKWDLRLYYSRKLYIYFIPFLVTPIIPLYSYNQNIIDTIWVQHQTLYVLAYFFFWYIKPSEKSIVKLLMLITIIYFLIRVLQNVLYPMEIVASSLKFERGVVRFSLPGDYFVVLFGFYSLRNIMKRKSFLINIFFWLISFISILLIGTRVLIIGFMAVSLFSIFLNRLNIRLIVFITLLVGLIIFLVIQFNLMEIIDNVLRLTQDQVAKGENYTRVQSFLFYVTDFDVNIFSFLFGHGYQEHTSQFGKIIEHYQLIYNFHASDIGIFGIYYYYGFIFTVGILYIYKKVYQISGTNEALKLFVIFVLLISPTLTLVNHYDSALTTGLVLYLSELNSIKT